jgi:nucleotide-binding universal stress UspA family protein
VRPEPHGEAYWYVIDNLWVVIETRGTHVADGWAACTFGPDAVSPEVTEDKAYLEEVRKEFQAAGIRADAFLAYGDPVKEIVRWVHERHCDLVAMSTHGHRFLADIFLGTTASRVQHSIDIPVLLIRAR